MKDPIFKKCMSYNILVAKDALNIAMSQRPRYGVEDVQNVELTSYDQLLGSEMCMHSFAFKCTTDIEIALNVEISYNIFTGRQTIVKWSNPQTGQGGSHITWDKREDIRTGPRPPPARIDCYCVDKWGIFKGIIKCTDDVSLGISEHFTFGKFVTIKINYLKALKCRLCRDTYEETKRYAFCQEFHNPTV